MCLKNTNLCFKKHKKRQITLQLLNKYSYKYEDLKNSFIQQIFIFIWRSEE